MRQPGQPLRIPIRTREERRLRRFTEGELQAISVELAAGRGEAVPRGRSGLPERRSVRQAQAAGIAFYRAMVRLRAA